MDESSVNYFRWCPRNFSWLFYLDFPWFLMIFSWFSMIFSWFSMISILLHIYQRMRSMKLTGQKCLRKNEIFSLYFMWTQELQIFSIRLQSLSDHVYLSDEVLHSLWSMCSYASALLFVEGYVFFVSCRVSHGKISLFYPQLESTL